VSSAWSRLPRDSYWGLRAYHGGEAMIGLEPTLAEHLERLVEVFREVRRVLRPDGVVWLNYGDAYSNSRSGPPGVSAVCRSTKRGVQRSSGVSSGLAPKQRLLLPARVALSLQDDGWWIRSEIVWAKGVSFSDGSPGSCMPSSVRDRPADSHEIVYLLTRSPRYFYDPEAVREEGSGTKWHGIGGFREGDITDKAPERYENTDCMRTGRNLRTVWCISPEAFPSAHFATFPTKLVRPCILAGTSERGACSVCGAPWERCVEATGGAIGKDWNPRKNDGERVNDLRPETQNGTYTRTTTGWRPTCPHADAPTRPCLVLDPFSGSGTTGVVALRLGRDYLGLELSEEYAELSRRRLRNALDPEARPLRAAEGQMGLW